MWILVKKEWQLDMRKQQVIYSLLLFIIASVFTCYLAMGKISDSQIWSSLYWIVGIFIAFQAMSKSFSQELEGAELLLNTLAHPRSIFFAKAFYYSLFIIILNLISFVLFLLFFGSSFFHGNTFFLTLASLFSGSVGMALTLTFLSALSFKVNQSSALTAVLGFPLIMPFLIITTKSLYAALLNDAEALYLSAMNIAIGFLMLLLGSFLVPFFWKS
ncbi:MAG: heme exporter protein CcmB [Bacteroidota bacterium]|jgi:heme exporter protein B